MEINDARNSDNKYIYDSEPSDWPSRNRASTDVCICPNCGATNKHKNGSPCFSTKCIKCGAHMLARETNRPLA